MSERGACGARARPGEPSPDDTACGAGGDSPFGREHAADGTPAAAAGAGGGCQPGPAVAVALDTKGGAGAALDADGEGSAGPAGVAVQDSVGRQLGEAENPLVRGGMPRQQAPRVGAGLA